MTKDALLKSVGGGTLVVLFTVPYLVLNCYVAWCLWYWFVVPLGAPRIGLLEMWGLSLAINYLINDPNQASQGSSLQKVGMSLAKPIVGLIVGWVLHQYV